MRTPASGTKVRLGLAVGLFASLAPAQVDWRAESIAPSPPARAEHVIAADPRRGEVLLFGGRGADGLVRADTWVFDGGTWAEHPGPGPSARRGAALAFHPSTGRLVLFGGYDAGAAALGDTWLWDGQGWTSAATVPAPPARVAGALAADPRSGDLILFGGVDAGGALLGDTWRFDGSGWRPQAGAGPGARFGHALVGDPARAEVLLFGGLGGSTATWAFRDGTGWVRRTFGAGPGPRWHHAMAFDLLRERVVLHGGSDGLAYALDDTWEWDGAAWSERAPVHRPSARIGAALAFAPSLERGLLVGGFDGQVVRGDLHSYGTDRPARLRVYGQGCAGSAGTPSIRAVAGLPWLGDMVRLRIDSLPPAGPVLLHFGFSDTAFGAVPLPLPLDGIGMPGCVLLASVDVVGSLTSRGGAVELALRFPPDPSIAGLRLFVQALVVDPGANALGLTASDALAIVVGVR